MDDLKHALGQRILELRRTAGLTQEQLAEVTGLSLKHLGELERGRSNPTLASLYSIATSLGLSLSELFDFKQAQLTPAKKKKALLAIIEKASDEDREMIHKIIVAIRG